jgi:hypothetical protein
MPTGVTAASSFRGLDQVVPDRRTVLDDEGAQLHFLSPGLASRPAAMDGIYRPVPSGLASGKAKRL